ncbi:TonB-dependent receptor domain-containing protein [Flavobacteriaceae bacterium M23B6Z8]
MLTSLKNLLIITGICFFGSTNIYSQLPKTLLIFVFLILSFNQSYAQKNFGDISVTVVDDQGQALEFAATVLYKAKDSTIAKIAMTDMNGKGIFEEIDHGKYYIHASFVGFNEKYSKVFTFNTPQLEVPTIMLSSNLELEEVTVRANRRVVERKIDRTVVNVGSTLVADGGNLADVMQIAPGVTVGNNGSLTLKGKSGVIVLIDGRASYMQGPDLENYLNSMPASQFKSIEIMTNPPAKYDAEGNAGIINIVTKKGARKGWNMDFTTSYRQGRFSIFSHNLGWNVNSEKLSFFGNVSFTDADTFDDYIIDRNFFDTNNELESVFDQKTFIRKENRYLTGRAGLDFRAGKNTTIGILLGAQKTDGTNLTDNTTRLRDGSENLLRTLIAPATSEADYDNFQANFHVIHKFDSLGAEISMDLDYLRYDSSIEQLFNNRFFDASGSLDDEEVLNNILPQVIDIYTAKVDYTKPLSEDSKIELGFKSSLVRTENDAQFFEIVGGDRIEDTNLSNFFKYDENVYAGYINYSQKLDDFYLQAGLRLESTDIEGNQVTQNTTFTNNYTNLLPSIFLTYNLDEESTLGISYGRRLERPDYRDLNPFRYFYDRFTFEEGNPALNPQFSNNIELNYSTWGGGLSTTAYYNKTTDIITDVIFQNADQNETFIRKDNLNDLITYGIGLNADLPIDNSWGVTLSLDYSNNELNGEVEGNPFDIQVNTFTAFMMHQYKFAKTWTFEVAGWYTSKSLVDTFVQEPYGRFAMAIGTSLWDGKGKIRLSGNDIFQWTDFVARSAFPNTDVRVDNTWQTQTIKLAFTYKFGSGYSKKRDERTSGNEEEQERLNSYEQDKQ